MNSQPWCYSKTSFRYFCCCQNVTNAVCEKHVMTVWVPCFAEFHLEVQVKSLLPSAVDAHTVVVAWQLLLSRHFLQFATPETHITHAHSSCSNHHVRRTLIIYFFPKYLHIYFLYMKTKSSVYRLLQLGNNNKLYITGQIPLWIGLLIF